MADTSAASLMTRIVVHRRSLILAATLISSLAFGQWQASAAHACSCRPPAPPQQQFAQAGAVFTGIVVFKTLARQAPSSPESVKVTMLVADAEKDVPGVLMEVWTNRYSESCGYDFQMLETYRIHTWQAPNGHHAASVCIPPQQITSLGAVFGSRLYERMLGLLAAAAVIGAAIGGGMIHRSRARTPR